MSRAFVREGDGDDWVPPARSVPTHANYVTARGLQQLQARARSLAGECETLRRIAPADTDAKQKLRVSERDLHYYHAQLERAELVTPAVQHDEIHFGARVTIRTQDSAIQAVQIVGDDEADASTGRISWASPLARALIGARVGDSATWQRPAGAVEIEILAVDYEQS